MMELSLKRVNILSKFKLKALLSNSYTMVFLALPLFMAIAMPFFYRMQLETDVLPKALLVVVAQIASVLNIGSIALTVPIMLMAEEKEKHTLRNLMVSSITPLEYLIGSLVPSFITSFLIQLAFLPILKAQFTMVELVQYILLSAFAVLISNMLGMCFGLYAKDQMSASLVPMPVSLLIFAIPVLAGKITVLKKMADFMYSTVVSDALSSLAGGKGLHVSLVSTLAMLVELFATTALFMYLYKRNGFEND